VALQASGGRLGDSIHKMMQRLVDIPRPGTWGKRARDTQLICSSYIQYNHIWSVMYKYVYMDSPSVLPCYLREVSHIKVQVPQPISTNRGAPAYGNAMALGSFALSALETTSITTLFVTSCSTTQTRLLQLQTMAPATSCHPADDRSRTPASTRGSTSLR
jgi:hypothetical protein